VRLTTDDYLAFTVAMVAAVVTAIASIEALPVLLTMDLGGGQIAWYAARASGMIAYVLATASVLFGIATSARLGGRVLGKGNIADAHRALSLLTLIAIGAHALFLSLDSYADFGLSDLFVPLATSYRPLWTGLGIVAAYVIVVVYVSFYIRPLIGFKAWRAFHYLAFAVFGLGAAHGIMAGADTHAALALALYAGTIATVLAMLVYRVEFRSPVTNTRTSDRPAAENEAAVAALASPQKL